MGWFWQWKPKISGVISGAFLRHKLSIFCPDAQIVITDREYQIPADPADVTWKVSPFDLPYVAESRDCDDFVRMARGWLSRKNLGNLLVMDCGIEKPDYTRHALLAFLGSTEIIFGEPQTGKLVTCDRDIKIYRLIA